MAATNFFPPKLLHSILILLLISTIPLSFSQSNPQNIQTFYTLFPPITDPPFLTPPTTPILPPQGPSRSSSSTKSTVGKAIGVTVASTLVISGLVFFLVLRHTRRKRERDNTTTITTTKMAYQTDSFMQFDCNLKGLIVDENGLDVMYWRKLEEGENMTNFKKENYQNLKDEQKEEEKRVISERGRNHKLPIQEAPLLSGNPSTSQSPSWGEKQEEVVSNASREPPLAISAVPKPLPPPPVPFHDKGSYKFNGDIMEALFGYVATNRKLSKTEGRSASPAVPPSQIFILDKDKSQNTATVLQSLGITRKEIIDALVGGRGLQRDTIEKLTRITPTDEESSEILAYYGDPTQLAYAESFLYHLLKAVPTAFTRFKLMLLKSNYESELLKLKVSLQSIEFACEELRNKGLFFKLLESVVKAGNRLNANAQAFNLTALKKLSDVRSTDGKTTLLQFVIMELIRSEGRRCVINRNRKSSDKSISKDEMEREYMTFGLPVIGCLSADFSNVKKSALLDYEVLVKKSLGLADRVLEIGNVLPQCGPGGFAREIRGFLDRAELEMKVMKEEQARVMDLVEKTLDQYGGGESMDKEEKNNPLELFVIARDFLGMVDQACIDIARYVQQRITASTGTGSSSPGFQTIFRFHKLPSDFMSETSKSSSNV